MQQSRDIVRWKAIITQFKYIAVKQNSAMIYDMIYGLILASLVYIFNYGPGGTILFEFSLCFVLSVCFCFRSSYLEYCCLSYQQLICCTCLEGETKLLLRQQGRLHNLGIATGLRSIPLANLVKKYYNIIESLKSLNQTSNTNTPGISYGIMQRD